MCSSDLEVMYDEAISEYRKSIAIDDRDPEILAKFGTLLDRMGRSLEAAAPLTEAARLDPGNASLRNYLGMVLATVGRPNEAVAQFEAAIRLKPDFREAHIRLGNVLSALGRIDEAEVQFSVDKQTGHGSPDSRPKLPAASPFVDAPRKE